MRGWLYGALFKPALSKSIFIKFHEVMTSHEISFKKIHETQADEIA
jgi:hypothetical protein